ncbi:hypothetical protein LJB89_03880 [Tyzzerella sp. OttesenSCG-928-J15]|nr:hypothetical protein [Tyzzerella sp. OttesenSCG-928-J15]
MKVTVDKKEWTINFLDCDSKCNALTEKMEKPTISQEIGIKRISNFVQPFGLGLRKEAS